MLKKILLGLAVLLLVLIVVIALQPAAFTITRQADSVETQVNVCTAGNFNTYHRIGSYQYAINSVWCTVTQVDTDHIVVNVCKCTACYRDTFYY